MSHNANYPISKIKKLVSDTLEKNREVIFGYDENLVVISIIPLNEFGYIIDQYGNFFLEDPMHIFMCETFLENVFSKSYKKSSFDESFTAGMTLNNYFIHLTESSPEILLDTIPSWVVQRLVEYKLRK